MIAKIATEIKNNYKQFLQLLDTRVSKSCFLTAFINALLRSLSLSLALIKVEVCQVFQRMFTMSCCLNRGGTREREGARGPPNFPNKPKRGRNLREEPSLGGKTYLIDRPALHSESRGQMRSQAPPYATQARLQSTEGNSAAVHITNNPPVRSVS